MTPYVTSVTHDLSITFQSSESIIDIILDTDRLMGIIPQVKWAEPVVAMTTQLMDTCVNHLSNNLVEVVETDKFRSLGTVSIVWLWGLIYKALRLHMLRLWGFTCQSFEASQAQALRLHISLGTSYAVAWGIKCCSFEAFDAQSLRLQMPRLWGFTCLGFEASHAEALRLHMPKLWGFTCLDFEASHAKALRFYMSRLWGFTCQSFEASHSQSLRPYNYMSRLWGFTCLSLISYSLLLTRLGIYIFRVSEIRTDFQLSII